MNLTSSHLSRSATSSSLNKGDSDIQPNSAAGSRTSSSEKASSSGSTTHAGDAFSHEMERAEQTSKSDGSKLDEAKITDSFFSNNEFVRGELDNGELEIPSQEANALEVGNLEANSLEAATLEATTLEATTLEVMPVGVTANQAGERNIQAAGSSGVVKTGNPPVLPLDGRATKPLTQTLTQTQTLSPERDTGMLKQQEGQKPELNALGGKVSLAGMELSSHKASQSISNMNAANAHNAVIANPLTSAPQPMFFNANVYANPMLAKKDFQQHIASLVSDKLELQVNSKSPSATIRLDPPELGKIELKVKLDGDKVSVHLTANNPHTRDAIQATVDRLRADLALEMNAQVTVSFSQSGQQKNDNDSVSQGKEQQGSVLTNSGDEASSLAASDHELINNRVLARI